MRKRILGALFSYSVIGLITLGLIEGILQLVQLQSIRSIEIARKLYQLSSREEYLGRYCHSYIWKSNFIQAYGQHREDFLSSSGLHVPHKTRGWTTKPNVTVEVGEKQYTTNNRGHRSQKDYQEDERKYSVLIVGDSYTFGSDADDSYAWTNLLQQKDERLQVINLAVGGYGIDQMYVTLKEEIDSYNPDLVMVAYISDDVFRLKYDFRDYKKPTLQVKGGNLEIENTPIGGIEETHQEIKAELQKEDIAILKLDDLLFNLKISCRYPPYSLFSKVMGQMQLLAWEESAQFLAVYLASGAEVEEKSHESRGEEVFQRWAEENEIETLNTRPYFLQGSGYQGGHYQQAEATIVSDTVYDKIMDLESWKKFVETNR
ncbi:SGNH/GDSL hydrolase family protein [Lusitaniella coriacea LEGE 07157]|uniref:SGNH/GDSL hydrolase family protein n=1 Tax=Lusitaniella coriacea LEGE 07157 TaxID=945747 RepID=A0A8J7J9Y5_9CYAN|nr:SGNH/GDSL hydrolase family protein [Lusitaniella coriacea]MBE9116380.1 SGNH/GDSL hydrolase family protein [Lusitaniella coriacea LEGE 07157]